MNHNTTISSNDSTNATGQEQEQQAIQQQTQYNNDHIMHHPITTTETTSSILNSNSNNNYVVMTDDDSSDESCRTTTTNSNSSSSSSSNNNKNRFELLGEVDQQQQQQDLLSKNRSIINNSTNNDNGNNNNTHSEVKNDNKMKPQSMVVVGGPSTPIEEEEGVISPALTTITTLSSTTSSSSSTSSSYSSPDMGEGTATTKTTTTTVAVESIVADVSGHYYYEKDANDCLTPEALIRVVSAANTTQQQQQQQQQNDILCSSTSNDNLEEKIATSQLSQLQQNQQEVRSGLGDVEDNNASFGEKMNKEEDMTEIVASIPPELHRNRNYDHQNRPGAYRLYGSSNNGAAGGNDNSHSNDDDIDDTSEQHYRSTMIISPPTSQNFMVEATLVTESMIRTGRTDLLDIPLGSESHHSVQTSPVQQQQLIYSAEVIVPPQPFTISNIILPYISSGGRNNSNNHDRNNDKSDHIVISKKSLRCMIITLIVLTCLTIIAITGPLIMNKSNRLVTHNNSSDLGDESGGGNFTQPPTIVPTTITEDVYHENVGKMLYQEFLLNNDNYNNGKDYDHHIITHHMSIITMQTENQNINFTTTCHPFRNNDTESTTFSVIHVDVAIGDSEYSSFENITETGSSFDDVSYNDPFNFLLIDHGIIIKLSCGDDDQDGDSSSRSTILLHNNELYKNPIINTTINDWPNTTVSIQPCEIVLNKNYNINDYMDENYDYSTIQCRLYPDSPIQSLIEQYMFVFTCIRRISHSTTTNPSDTTSNYINSTFNNISNNSTNSSSSAKIVASLSTNNVYTACTATEYKEMDGTVPLTSTIYLGMERLCQYRSSNIDTGSSISTKKSSTISSMNYNNTGIAFRSSLNEQLYDSNLTSDTVGNRICFPYDYEYQINTNVPFNMNMDIVNETYCKTTSNSDLYLFQKSRVFQADIDYACRLDPFVNDSRHMDYLKQCEELQKSDTFYAWVPVIPNVTIIDRWYSSSNFDNYDSIPINTGGGSNTSNENNDVEDDDDDDHDKKIDVDGNEGRVLQEKQFYTNLEEIYVIDDGDVMICSFDSIGQSLVDVETILSQNDTQYYYTFSILSTAGGTVIDANNNNNNPTMQQQHPSSTDSGNVLVIQSLMQELLQRQMDIIPQTN